MSILGAIKELIPKKKPKEKQSSPGSNGHEKKSKLSTTRQQIPGTPIIISTDGNQKVAETLAIMANQMQALSRKQEEQDLIGKEGKRDLALAMISPPWNARRQMCRISRRAWNLLSADETFDILMRPEAEWPTDPSGRKLTPEEVWRDSYYAHSLSVQGKTTEKVGELAGLQATSDEQSDNTYISGIKK